MTIQIKLYENKDKYDSVKVDRLNTFINNYQSCIQLLASHINSNQMLKIDTSVKPVDSHSPLIKVEQMNPIDMASGHRIGVRPEQKIKKPTTGLMKPPVSKGLPIKRAGTIHRTVSLYENEFNLPSAVSTDHSFTTDSVGRCSDTQNTADGSDCVTDC